MNTFDVIWLFLLMYFIGFHTSNLLLYIISFVNISNYMKSRSRYSLPLVYTDFMPPISVLVPAHNEEIIIVASVRSLLQLNYPEYEIIVINDGSEDRTLEVLSREFSLVPFLETYRVRIQTRRLRAVYHSTIYPNLRVFDKENGGKADAINAGINGSRYPLFCAMDADSVLMRDSLQKIVEPFLENPATVASGGIVRVANGCNVRGGFLVKVGLPSNLLALFQIIEYLRAFLFGRIGWVPMNALLIISGAFGLFRKESVISVGGYRTDTVGEDMELVVRLHRRHRLEGKPYRITFVPDPICWTEAPEDLKTLKKQRVRWQRGLSESLTMNFRLLFNPRGGTAGWLAFPFFVIFEWLGPIVEAAAYALTAAAFLFGVISAQAVAFFLIVAVGFGILLSVTALLLEEISFHIYPKTRHIPTLFLVAVMENLGYRQLVSFWRLIGLFRWAFVRKSKWGEMKRKASWQRTD